MMTSLVLTHDCNLRCSYCFAGRKKKDEMKVEVGKKAIDFVYENYSDKELVINFFGGEPLLCYENIPVLVDYARSKMNSNFGGLRFSITTNGTILDEQMADYFIKNNFFFTLSLDGNEYSQNKCRKTVEGTGSYSMAEKNFPLWFKMIEGGCPVTVRMTVDIENVDGLFDSVRDLIDIGFKRIVFTPNVSDDWTDEHIELYKEQFKKIADLYVQNMENGTPFYCASIEKYIRRKLKNTVPGCSAVKNRISVSPTGNIYPCHRFVGEDTDENVMVGNIYTGFNNFRDEFISKYNKEHGCDACVLVKRCGNVCSAVNYQLLNNINSKPWFTCECERFAISISDDVWSRLYGKRNKIFMSYMLEGRAV